MLPFYFYFFGLVVVVTDWFVEALRTKINMKWFLLILWHFTSSWMLRSHSLLLSCELKFMSTYPKWGCPFKIWTNYRKKPFPTLRSIKYNTFEHSATRNSCALPTVGLTYLKFEQLLTKGTILYGQFSIQYVWAMIRVCRIYLNKTLQRFHVFCTWSIWRCACQCSIRLKFGDGSFKRGRFILGNLDFNRWGRVVFSFFLLVPTIITIKTNQLMIMVSKR